jgi:hypothetical protein
MPKEYFRKYCSRAFYLTQRDKSCIIIIIIIISSSSSSSSSSSCCFFYFLLIFVIANVVFVVRFVLNKLNGV